MDTHSSAAAETAAQQELLQPQGVGLQLAAVAVDVADSPAAEAGIAAAAAALEMEASVLQAAEEAASQAAAVAVDCTGVSAAAADNIAAAAVEHAMDAMQEQPEAAALAAGAGAAVQAADLPAAAVAVHAACSSPAAGEGGSATATLQQLEAALLVDASQQQQQQQASALEVCDAAAGCFSSVHQERAQLLSSDASDAVLEADAAIPAAAAAEQAVAPVAPIWPPGVYLTPQMAQLLNEHGGSQVLLLVLLVDVCQAGNVQRCLLLCCIQALCLPSAYLQLLLHHFDNCAASAQWVHAAAIAAFRPVAAASSSCSRMCTACHRQLAVVLGGKQGELES
jgi:hypothetical protein